MKKLFNPAVLTSIALSVHLIASSFAPACARGGFGGGGYHGAGGDFGGHFDSFQHGGFGDFHEAGYHGSDFGGAHYGEYGGAHYGGYGGAHYGEYGGAHYGEYGGAHYGAYSGGNLTANHAWNGGVSHIPTDAGFGNLSSFHGSANQFHNFDASSNKWNSEGVRNSFNHYNNVNFNHFGNNYGYHGNWNGYHGWGGYGYHGWGGYGYHGAWWGYPGGWYCPGWGMATAWTCLGLSSLDTFLGLAMLSNATSGGGSNKKAQPSVTNITYQGPNVYVNGSPYCSAQDYYQQAQGLAAAGVQYTPPQYSGAPPASEGDNWRALGVFSLAQQGQTESIMLFQLAINKEGIVRGNYFNQLTNETEEVYGSLNKQTQRVSFMLGQTNSTVFDTTLSDLTKNEAPVLVHYGPDNTRAMMLVRVQPPEGQAKTAAPS